MTHEYDVIICGAGPAGCTAALALGTSGRKVALVDKDTFPRDKVCGDAVPAYAQKVLNSINPLLAEDLGKQLTLHKVNKCRIFAPDENTLDLDFPEYGFICKRIEFDNFLFSLASSLQNTTVFQNLKIIGISADKNGVIATASDGSVFKASLVIGCDGANSVVRRHLSGPRCNNIIFSSAARTYFKNVRDIPETTYEIHFLRNLLPGYFWIFPLPGNEANVGLGLPPVVIAEKKMDPRKELSRIIETVPYLRSRFSQAEMTGELKAQVLPLGLNRMDISGERIMLCGDAASLINPATGAGIGHAMQSGRYAGWHAVKCFDHNKFSEEFMRDYDMSVFSKIREENRYYLKIRKYVLEHPGRINILVNTGSKFKYLRKKMTKLLK